MDPQLTDLLAAHAQLVAPPLVSELRVWTAVALAPFWEAAETRFGRINSPFWAFAWPGGQALARYLLDHPERVRGRRVLDVGCGGGIAALASALAGGVTVANDVDPLALRVVVLNAAVNNVPITTSLADLTDSDVDADLVIVGDVCYEREGAARLLAWLRVLARTRPVLLADAGRAFAPTEGFTELARYYVPTTWDLEGRTERCTRVLEIERA